jgi:hypothetical protein
MSILTEVYVNAIVALSQTATPTPGPIPGYAGDEDLVTPTWVGFVMTFVVALATVLLLVDMTRRVRRTRYRGEIREKLEAEAEAAAGTATGAAPDTAPGANAGAGAAAAEPEPEPDPR